MSLSYGKLVRGLYLLLFLSSSILSFIKPNAQTGLIAILSIVGFIAFEALSYFKDQKKDMTSDLLKLQEHIQKVEKELSEIKSDHSLAHLAATFKRNK